MQPISMLINYSCTNYKSYRNKTAFTFSASKIKQFDKDNITSIDSSLTSKNRILNSLVFVGANAAGKSNILKSISYASEDFSRTSLSSFIKKYGDLSDRDFVLFAVYFDEQRNNKKEFNAKSIKQYYIEARRTPYSNNSMLIKALIHKGYIMDVASQDDKTGKFYMLTDTGLSYIKQYTPKEDIHEKKIKKSHKSSTKAESQYAGLTADDLNIKNYPKVKDQKGAINQLILALYIVTNENKGEWFTFIDIEYLFNQIFEIPFNVSTIKNAINAHKSWFTSVTDDKNKKANKYKLLSGAKDEVEKLIQGCL